jgi:iron complex outermembrane receptor protein
MLAAYGSYSQSFNPVFGIASAGGALVPETAFQWEGGIKADLLDKKLSFSAAGYYIVKNNVAVPDPTKDIFFFLQLGQARSQGAELSLAGKLTEYWSIIANYAYTDTKVTQNQDPTLVGKRFLSVPFNSGSLWTRYNFLQRPDKTLGAAIGLVGVGDRPGDLQNSFELPSYARWDAGFYYRRRQLSISVYFENVFDIQYYTGSVSAFQVIPGAPFNVRGAVRWEF